MTVQGTESSETLGLWDKVDLDRLAFDCKPYGKQPAARVYHHFAKQRGWFGRPIWIEGRNYFQASHRALRLKKGLMTPRDEPRPLHLAHEEARRIIME